MRAKLLIFLFFIVIIFGFIGCIESQKIPAPNETKITTPTLSPTEQKLPNETKPLKINNTFETWSRGYWSNTSYGKPYFRVITNYSEWNDFLDEQGYLAWMKGEGPMRLEGNLFPGLNKMPKTITSADFNENFIIAAMMGRIGIAEGPEIEIKNISRLNNVVNVTVYMYKLGPGAQVQSAPYHIVIVKRELLSIGNSTFVFRETEGKLLGKLEVTE